MSGPVTTADVSDVPVAGAPEPASVDLLAGRRANVGGVEVRRLLPQRGRRLVGAWCFADHMGPGPGTGVPGGTGLDVGPHPHMGLQTVTWLVEGEVLHRDSLGSEQVVRPGQLNLMTAGHGVSHAEEATGPSRSRVRGVQLWVAQPSATRDGPAAFEHHPELPVVELGAARATVLVGGLAGATSPARRDTDHVGAELDLGPGRSELPLDPASEHALVVLEGRVRLGGPAIGPAIGPATGQAIGPATGPVVEPGTLAYLGTGRDELAVEADARARVLLVGGVPFPEPVLMWWNYVGRDRAELTAAHRSWTDDDGRFGRVRSPLPRLTAPPPPWAGPAGGRSAPAG